MFFDDLDEDYLEQDLSKSLLESISYTERSEYRGNNMNMNVNYDSVEKMLVAPT